MSIKLTWDQRFIELIERIRAASIADIDVQLLDEEFQRLMAEKPPEKKNASNTTY